MIKIDTLLQAIKELREEDRKGFIYIENYKEGDKEIVVILNNLKTTKVIEVIIDLDDFYSKLQVKRMINKIQSFNK